MNIDREQRLDAMTDQLKSLVGEGEINSRNIIQGWTILMELSGVDTDFYKSNRGNEGAYHEGILGVWISFIKERDITDNDAGSAHDLLQNEIRPWILGKIHESDRAKAERFLDAMNSVGWRRGDIEKIPQEPKRD